MPIVVPREPVLGSEGRVRGRALVCSQGWLLEGTWQQVVPRGFSCPCRVHTVPDIQLLSFYSVDLGLFGSFQQLHDDSSENIPPVISADAVHVSPLENPVLINAP